MTSHREKIRLAVVYGGRSGEHDISVRSARSILNALDPERYSVREYFISREGKWSPNPILPEPGANPDIDLVFPVLHGTFGEDGTVQGLLELADLPYVGAGVFASAAAMDKVMTKRLCAEAGLPVVQYLVLRSEEVEDNLPRLPFGLPAFVKPANLGSSVGISKAKTPVELRIALREAAKFDRKILVEAAVVGREFECAVLGGSPARASVPCEILPSEEFYTYDDKYVMDKANIELPARLSEGETARMQNYALACFEAVGCEGMARVDFLKNEKTGEMFINEINTIPGFTSISMYPKMWEYSGVPYRTLLNTLIDLALERGRIRRQLQYSR